MHAKKPGMLALGNLHRTAVPNTKLPGDYLRIRLQFLSEGVSVEGLPRGICCILNNRIPPHFKPSNYCNNKQKPADLHSMSPYEASSIKCRGPRFRILRFPTDSSDSSDWPRTCAGCCVGWFPVPRLIPETAVCLLLRSETHQVPFKKFPLLIPKINQNTTKRSVQADPLIDGEYL